MRLHDLQTLTEAKSWKLHVYGVTTEHQLTVLENPPWEAVLRIAKRSPSGFAKGCIARFPRRRPVALWWDGHRDTHDDVEEAFGYNDIGEYNDIGDMILIAKPQALGSPAAQSHLAQSLPLLVYRNVSAAAVVLGDPVIAAWPCEKLAYDEIPDELQLDVWM